MELARLITEQRAGWTDWPVERLVFGTDDPEAIATLVERFCSEKLGAPIAEPSFFESSVGSVFGLGLADGRQVIVKAHQPNEPLESLRAIHSVQAHLAAAGYPCPQPVLAPTPLGRGYATVEELRLEGEWMDAHDPSVRRTMATTLARLVEVSRDFVDLPGLRPGLLSRIPAGRLWPEPHSAIFDFEASAGGAEWIDELAARARELLRRPAGQLVVGHVDWSVKHFRFVDGAVSVIYDWDSLAVDPEPVIVGGAARSFTFTWRLPVPLAPSLEESRAFVAEYEAARGAAFTPRERATVGAAAVYGLAYTARCEHSLGKVEAGNALEALAAHGRELFAL